MNPREPDAATWLSTALWGLHPEHEDFHREPPPFAEGFAPLLRDYPDSLAADVVRFSVAHEHLRAGRFAPAADLLLPMADRLAGSLPEERENNVLRAFLAYDTALAALKTGRRAEAATFLARAEEAGKREKTPLPQLLCAAWVYPDVRHYGGQVAYEGYRWTGPMVPKWAGFAGDVAALRAEWDVGPEKTPTTPAAPGFAWPREEFERIEKMYGRERLSRQQELLARLADAADREPAVFAGAMTGDSQGADQVLPFVEDLIVVSHTDAERDAVHRLTARVAAPLPANDQIRLSRAAGDRAAQADAIRRALAAETNPQRKIDRQADLIRLTEGPEAKADFLFKQIPPGFKDKRGVFDDGQWLPLAFDAAEAYRRAGRWDRAAEVYETAAAHTGRPDWWCSASIYQAECEQRRGDPVKAAALLRTVIEWSQGEIRSVIGLSRSNGAPGDLYTVAVERLQELRRAGRADRVAPPAAGPVPGDGPIALPATVPRDPVVAAELEEVLFDAGLHHPWPPTSDRPHETFAKRHGHAAVPAVLDVLARLPRLPSGAESQGDLDAPWGVASHNRVSQLAWILRQTETSAETPNVLAAFRRFPDLADAAFKLAPREATAVFDQLVRETGGRMDNFVNVVTRYHLDAYLDGLFEEAAGGEDGFDWCATSLNVMLDRQPDPAGESRLRDALEQSLERRRLGRRWPGVNWAALREVAGRRGVRQFIECILDHPEYSPADRARYLRPILALPPTPLDDPALVQMTEANRGRWQWQATDRRFHLPPNP